MDKLPLMPGFRFHPSDDELVMYYLKRKVMGKRFPFEAIAEIELYKFAPWDLREMSCLGSKDLVWFFFCPPEKKYVNGQKTNRVTKFGFWKATGNDKPIPYESRTVGMKKTLVFHEGKAPCGRRTDWVMYEYRLEDKLAGAGVPQDKFVVCKVFKKSGRGPKNGEHYGAPFKEEDWGDTDEGNDSSVPRSLEQRCQSPRAEDGQNTAITLSSLDCGNGNISVPETSQHNSETPMNSPFFSDDEIQYLLEHIIGGDSNTNMHSEKMDFDQHGSNVQDAAASEIMEGLKDTSGGQSLIDIVKPYLPKNVGDENVRSEMLSSLEDGSFLEMNDLHCVKDVEGPSQEPNDLRYCLSAADVSQFWTSDCLFEDPGTFEAGGSLEDKRDYNEPCFSSFHSPPNGDVSSMYGPQQVSRVSYHGPQTMN